MDPSQWVTRLAAGVRLRTNRSIARVSRATAGTSRVPVPWRGEPLIHWSTLPKTVLTNKKLQFYHWFIGFRCIKQGKINKFLTYYECECADGFTGDFNFYKKMQFLWETKMILIWLDLLFDQISSSR